MKTFTIKVQRESDTTGVTQLLEKLASEGTIVYQECTDSAQELHPATENQVQEIIDEAELAPYYSDKEAKRTLNL